MTRKLLLVAFLALACAMLADRVHPSVDAGVAGDTILISLQNGEDALTPPFAAGTLGNGDSINASMSANGRFIVFESLASNLLTGGGVVDNNNSSDIVLRDVQNNTIELISVNNAGTASGCFNGAEHERKKRSLQPERCESALSRHSQFDHSSRSSGLRRRMMPALLAHRPLDQSDPPASEGCPQQRRRGSASGRPIADTVHLLQQPRCGLVALGGFKRTASLSGVPDGRPSYIGATAS